ncbi:MAG: endonuclease/exonuclease/phosphatase family protein [Bacteroidota bacterium]|nr:endonuclease/exonuclease/phosphatase family protein [Bacteroidota bacterium]
MQRRNFHIAGLVVFGVLASIALAATLLPLSRSKKWYIRVFDYPRLQTLIIAILALAWYQAFYFRYRQREMIYWLVLLTVIAVQIYKAWPYTAFGPKQVLNAAADANEEDAISFFISNVLQTNTAYQKVMDTVSRYSPDIVITTETDSTWQQELEPLETEYPHRVAIPQSNMYGMHLYSRLPLRQPEVRYLIEQDIPSIRTGVQLRSGQWVTLFVVHPRPPFPGEADETSERDAEIILVAKEAKQTDGGVIVAGDFNDVAWSETTELFQEVSGFLDPRRGRGFYNTFHAQYPIFRWPLDHIFHSAHFKLAALDRAPSVNSDHFPMYIKLSYQPEEKEDQPEVQPDADTEKEAEETIREGKKKAGESH